MPRQFYRPLAARRVIDTMIFAGLKPGSHGMRAETAAELWTRFGGALPILAAPDVETALRWAVPADPDLVVCAGSLYLTWRGGDPAAGAKRKGAENV